MEIGLLLTDNITKRQEEFDKKGINYTTGIGISTLKDLITILEVSSSSDREVLQELKKHILIIEGKIKIDEEKKDGA